MISDKDRQKIAEGNGLPIWKVCMRCGMADQKVEGGGLWFCPRCCGVEEEVNK